MSRDPDKPPPSLIGPDSTEFYASKSGATFQVVLAGALIVFGVVTGFIFGPGGFLLAAIGVVVEIVRIPILVRAVRAERADREGTEND